MRLWERGLARLAEKRHSIQTINDWIMLFGGHQYPIGLNQSIRGDKEPPPTSFEGYAHLLFAANPVVWAAEQARKAVFSQARFQWRNLEDGRLFDDPTLRLLERPWPGGSTKKLLTRMLLHGDIGGNGYVLRTRPDRVQLMRPDWVTIILGSRLEPTDPAIAEDAELAGFMYTPGGTGTSRFYLPDEVGHFAPMPDPLAHYRGMSWLTPVVREIQGDKMTTEHKLKFFEQGATPNLILKFDPSLTVEQVRAFKELIEEDHTGLADAYKTMYLGGGADPTVVGANLRQLDFANTQGKAETRILMAAGVHAVVAGASEGMHGSALNSGNFNQVRRLFSDVHLQDLWMEAASSLQVLLQTPPSSELVMDGRNIPFLQDDQSEQAETQRTQSRAITTLVRDGFTPESAIAAVTGNDMSLLEHTGLLSVQLQPPGTTADEGNQNQGDDDGDGDN